jgi:hypothetical protein
VSRPGVLIREATAEDLPFIFGTWLNHFHGNSYFAKRIRNGVYFRYHHLLAERILSRPTTRVLLATLSDDPLVILGYLVVEQNAKEHVVHFAFVKKPWQRMGLARDLVSEAGVPSDLAGVSYTHPTYQWWQELEPKYPQSIYNPYLI